jgi:myo-inositol 2-dehydrogenase/D-chiro-inositol 1-dehydrogenase
MFRLGLIGAGRMGQTHLAALVPSTLVTVTSIVEPRETVASELRATGYTVFDSVDALLDANDVDGFLVATPSGFHVDVIRELAGAGLPILCEKPGGLSVSDAVTIKEIVESAGVRLHIGYWRRFVPTMIALKKDIDEGRLGRLLVVHASQWDHRPPAAEFRNTSGGIAVDMGVHEIDVIHWLTGQSIASANTSTTWSDDANVTDEDSAVLSFELSDGTVGLATLGRFYPDADFVGIEVMGDSGHQRHDILAGIDGDRVFMNALRDQAEAFAQGGNSLSATIDDAIAALGVTSAITEKSRS